MLRTLLLLIALFLLVVVGLVWLGVIDLRQTREGALPTGGQAPAFEVDVDPVRVGTETRNVQVPVIRMENRQVEVPTIGRERREAAEEPPAE
jgi:hypothetical protein